MALSNVIGRAACFIVTAAVWSLTAAQSGAQTVPAEASARLAEAQWVSVSDQAATITVDRAEIEGGLLHIEGTAPSSGYSVRIVGSSPAIVARSNSTQRYAFHVAYRTANCRVDLLTKDGTLANVLIGSCGPGSEMRGAWKSGVAYVFGDLAMRSGTTWLALQSNKNKKPGESPEDWQVFAARGATGSAGPAGPAGETGPQGAAGPAGEIGPQGAAGPAGEIGPQGAAGPAGETGPQGAAGPAGEIGPQGAAGPAGETGPQGNPGPVGQTGLQGDPGFTGPPGPAGFTGATGPAGPQGFGLRMSVASAEWPACVSSDVQRTTTITWSKSVPSDPNSPCRATLLINYLATYPMLFPGCAAIVNYRVSPNGGGTIDVKPAPCGQGGIQANYMYLMVTANGPLEDLAPSDPQGRVGPQSTALKNGTRSAGVR